MARRLTKTQRSVSFLEERLLVNQVDLIRAGTVTANLMVAELMRAMATVRQFLDTLPADSPFNRAYYEIAMQQIGGTLVTLPPAYKTILTAAMTDAIIREYGTVTTALLRNAKLATTSPVPPMLPVRQIEAILNKPVFGAGGKSIGEWAERRIPAMVSDIRRELSQSVILGESSATARVRLMETLGMERKSADAMARTGLVHAGTQAREEVYKENKDVILQFRYLATLDKRTCPVCGPLDGKLVNNYNDLPTLPIHSSCRCLVMAVTRFDEPITRPAVLETEDTVVHHRDGSTSTKHRPTKVQQVDSTTTWSTFFKQRPESWQREVLGPGRFQLWKDGKISLDDMKDKFHAPRTLKELNALISRREG